MCQPLWSSANNARNHSHDDLILEVPMRADQEKLSVAPGHAFFLRNGRLSIQKTPFGCGCESPESHEQRVANVLRISSLVQDGKLILLPHPVIDGWYVVITGEEQLFIQEDIEWARKVIGGMIQQLAAHTVANPPAQETAHKSATKATVSRSRKTKKKKNSR